MKKYLIVIIVILLIIVGFVVFYQQKLSATACTKEAKICPDGTTVGRQGPNCEFTECRQSVSSVMTKENWQAKLPEIKNLVIAKFPENGIGAEWSRPINITKTFSVAGINGAIVDLGVGGASTYENAIVMFINEQLKIVDVRDGNKIQNNFLIGASATHGNIIDFSSGRSVLYVANWSNSVDSKSTCDLKAYTWSDKDKSFVIDLGNTNVLKTEYCKNNPPRGDI